MSGNETPTKFSADWFDNPHLARGGHYGVRGPDGLVLTLGPFKADWEKAQKLADEMNTKDRTDHPGRQEVEQ